MSVDRLGSTSGLIAALRSEVTRRTGLAPRAAATSTTQRRSAASVPHDKAVLKRDLRELVRAVDASDPQAVDAVRPRVVRAILLWEFGAGLREHPDWVPMLDAIVRALEGSAEHRTAFTALARGLRRSA